ncbi:polysaccharide lyase [Microbulbifer agarilyticus]|nr:hypothetical protein [Microbulbifer agarilyticus]
MFESDWGFSPNTSAGVADGRLNIVSDPYDSNNAILRVSYTENAVGGSSASVFTYQIPDAPHSNLWLQYQVMFDDQFTWVKGGKLPGLGGYVIKKPTGCLANSEIDGFSGRFMWRESGHVFQYLYNPSKREYCGDYSSLYRFFSVGRWHTITSHVELNSVGGNDGKITAYLDGELALELTGLNLRTDESVSIDKLLFETFFGGSSSEWMPSSQQYSYFDNIVISTTSPLNFVATTPDNGTYEGPHPAPGYIEWQVDTGYDENNLVYAIDTDGTHHYYRARYGIAANKSPLDNSLPENYVGIYSPERLDNGAPWVELNSPE